MTNYKEMKYQDLQKAAKAKGLTVFGVKKPDLINLLEKTEKVEEVAVDFVKDVREPEAVEDNLEEIEGGFDPDKADVVEVPKEEVVLNKVEPKIFQPDHTGESKQVVTAGGAPDGVFLNEYLLEKGITMRELNNAVSIYLNNNNPARNVTMGSLRDLAQKGVDKARVIDASEKTRVEVNDIHIADALRATFNWKPKGRTKTHHILER